MSVNFGDIIRGAELCLQILNILDGSNKADKKYLEFRSEVANLRKSLKEFHDAFKKAVPHIRDADYCRLQEEATEIVGDFMATLTECNNLLEDHKKLGKSQASILDTVLWHTFTQDKVDSLRRRIQSHTERIRLILEPVQLHLITSIFITVSEILDLLRKHYGLPEDYQIPQVPGSLDSRFEANLYKDSPLSISSPTSIPLKEGFEVLVWHFRHSTTDSIGSDSKQTPEQYLNLLKSHWLVQVLTSSQGLKKVRPSHLYHRVIKQIEAQIAKEYNRPDIIQWSEDDLLGKDLPDSAFAIWPPKTITRPTKLTEAAKGEQKLHEIELVPENGYEKQTLIIFQVSKNMFRLVQTGVKTDPEPDEQGKELLRDYLDLSSSDGGVIVPGYAIASPLDRRWWLKIGYRRGIPPVVYEVPDRKSMFAFQKVFTTYDVSADSQNISCTVTYRQSVQVLGFLKVSRVLPNEQIKGKGDIQLWGDWQGSTEESTSEESNAPNAPRSSIKDAAESEVKSFGSRSELSPRSAAFRKTGGSVVSVTKHKNVKCELAEMPRVPLLVVFMKMDDTYAILKIDLSQIILSDGNSRKKLGIKGKNSSFQARKLSVRDVNLDSWNMCALFLQQETMPDDNGIETLECTWISLSFPSEEAKEDFKIKLQLVLSRRKNETAEFLSRRKTALNDAVQVETETNGKPTNSKSGLAQNSSSYTLRPVSVSSSMRMDFKSPD